MIAPTHFDRVPQPNNLFGTIDTTNLGKYFVTLSWQVNRNNNLKNFEVRRAINNIASDQAAGNTTETNFVDSNFTVGANDSILFYYVVPQGEDRFVGQSSETIKLNIK
ncbi:MAG: hypothetical protein ABI550_02055 [Ignavibacteriaceae bacterium]